MFIVAKFAYLRFSVLHIDSNVRYSLKALLPNIFVNLGIQKSGKIRSDAIFGRKWPCEEAGRVASVFNRQVFCCSEFGSEIIRAAKIQLYKSHKWWKAVCRQTRVSRRKPRSHGDLHFYCKPIQSIFGKRASILA